MRIWSILLMKSDLKWCIHLDLFLLCRLRSIATHRDNFVRRLSVCLSVRLSVCLSVCLSVRPSVTLAKLCFAGDTCIPRNAATILFQPLHSLGECHCWWTRESLRAHVAKFYSRLQLIRSVSRASTFSVLKFIDIIILGVYSPSLFDSVCFGTFVIFLFNFLATLFG